MKKILLLVAASAVGACIVYWGIVLIVARVGGGEALATSVSRPWPGRLGTIDSAASRYPHLRANEAAATLTTLGNALPKDDRIADFVSREITRGEVTVAEAPPIPELTAIRDLLLHRHITWGRRGGVGEIGDPATSTRRGLQMTMARALVASALARALANDRAAWDDLQALSNLARSIEPQPEVMEQTAAFSMRRMINAVAWKMPLPAPAWLGELQKQDALPRLLEAFQYQVASYSDGGERVFATKWLAAAVDHDQRIAEALFSNRGCVGKTPMNKLGTDLTSVWQRALRHRAEREASANALRIREGRAFQNASHCSGAAWSYDGTTLRLGIDLAPAGEEKVMPLVLRVSPEQGGTAAR